MNRRIFRGVAVALPLILATGCDDFLTGNRELTDDPNRPTQATLNQRFAAVQAAVWTVHTGEVPRAIAMWMQQMSGTDRQYQTLGTYTHGEATFGTPWTYIYGGGGLVDLRAIQDGARELNDRTYLGIAQALEALQIGTAADWWGDVPYSEAVAGNPTPKLDPQLEVYAAIQTLLDEAIANLGSGTGGGPGIADFVYGGNRTKWTQFAWTLKARYYMHVAERDASAYAKALAAARNGISTPANDYTTVHPGTPGERNLWYQFIEIERQQYLSPGSYLVDSLLETRNDSRLARYFTPGSTGQFRGAVPGEGFTAELSQLNPATRNRADFAQPIVTYDENQLIIAEAAYRTGDQTTALTALNTVRARHGMPALAVSGTTLLREIMLEKYIALFQSPEVWNDWKRTCIPDLTPALGAQIIPARLFYPADERNTNPNIPAVSAQTARNPNDPANAGCNSQN